MNNQAFLLQMVQKFRQGATEGWSRVWGRYGGPARIIGWKACGG